MGIYGIAWASMARQRESRRFAFDSSQTFKPLTGAFQTLCFCFVPIPIVMDLNQQAAPRHAGEGRHPRLSFDITAIGDQTNPKPTGIMPTTMVIGLSVAARCGIQTTVNFLQNATKTAIINRTVDLAFKSSLDKLWFPNN